VPVTFIAVMMRSNHDRLAEIARIAKGYDAPLRINVYQAVRSDTFALTYEEYWTGFERLFAETDVVAIGEPLVRAMAGMPPRNGGCGVATVRVTPRATVQPCVYWPGGARRSTSFSISGPAWSRRARSRTRGPSRRPARVAPFGRPARAAARAAGG
jgi:MoaA/NifB/PqqE/SkfB family radical SAM enzyme